MSRATLFLASDESEYITPTELVVDGRTLTASEALHRPGDAVTVTREEEMEAYRIDRFAALTAGRTRSRHR
ncbi:MAG: hypothetical protein JO212_19000 [Acetobacteraceae bacterium]|nr:hypothetical protein [Acetobacteraceae bacterium]